MAQRNISFFIRTFCLSYEHLIIFLCKSFLSFERQCNKFKSGGLRKAVAFLKGLMESYPQMAEPGTWNPRLAQLYCHCLARAASSLNQVDVESIMEEDFEICLKLERKEDYTLFMIEAFWHSLNPKGNKNQTHSVFLSMFTQASNIDRLSPKILLHFFNDTAISAKEKQEAFKLLFCAFDGNINNENLLITLKLAITDPSKMPGMPVKDFLEQFKDFRPDEVNNAFLKFLDAKDVQPMDENMIANLLASPQAAVQAYANESRHYYPALLRQMAACLADLPGQLAIGHLAAPHVFTPRKIEIIESLLRKSDPTAELRPKLTEITLRIESELKDLEKIERVLMSNKEALGNFQFYRKNWDELQDIKLKTLNTMNLRQLQSTPVYNNTKMMLDEEFWLRNRFLMSYKLFRDKVESQTNPDISLPDYFAIIKKTAEEFRDIVSQFADRSKYTLNDYNIYFPRIAFKENSDLYWTFLHGLELSQADQENIIRSSIMFHSVRKVIKMKEPVENLLGFLKVDASKDELASAISDLADKLSQISEEELTVEKVVKFDSHQIINVEDLDESLTYRMPMFLKVVAKSPLTLDFIAKTNDEFIKAMREEVEDENLDLMNMLDIINKNLKYIVEDPKITLKHIIKRSFLIHKFDQRRLKEFLKKVEPQIEKTIIFLAEKTKKDTNYHKNIISSMLKSSEIKIYYENMSKKFIVEVYFIQKDKTVMLKPFEFEELLNKSKIIAAESNSKNEEENRDFNQAMKNFSYFGIQLEQLSLNLGNLRDLGIIHTRITDLLYYINKDSLNNSYYSAFKDPVTAVQDHKTLFFSYTKTAGENRNLRDLEATNAKLRELHEKLKAELDAAYSNDSYLMTLFHGKRLFFLIELLRGKTDGNNERLNHVKEMITSFVPDTKVDLTIVNKLKSEPEEINPETIIADVKANLIKWGEKIIYSDTVVEPQTKVLTSRKIKLCTNSANTYKTMLKILSNAEQPMLCLSHMLLCTRNTTFGEILSFCRRAMLDPFKKIYFALGAERLPFEQIVFLKKTLLDLHKSRIPINKNLVIFTSKGNLFESDEVEVIDELIKTLEVIEVQDKNLVDTFSSFNTTKIVISDQAGMGKSTFIKKQSVKHGMNFDIFFCGEMSKNSIKHRLNNLAQVVKNHSAKEKKTFALTVKLDYIEDFDFNSVMLDYLVFCICMVRCFYTEEGCFNFSKQLGESFLEVSNSFKLELMSTLDFIKLFAELAPGASEFATVESMPAFAFELLEYSAEQASDEQTVARFLQELAADRDHDGQAPVPQDQFRALVQQFFLKDFLAPATAPRAEATAQTTFSQYRFWLKTLASLARDMNAVNDFSLAGKALDKDEDEAKIKKLKSLRKQIMMELLQFCTYIINVSVSQAKSSQDEMKKMMDEIKKDRSKLNEIMSKYTNKFTNITPWNSNTLIVPLFRNKTALFAMKKLDNIFISNKVMDVTETEKTLKDSNRSDNLRAGARKELRDYIIKSGLCLTFDKGSQPTTIQCMNLFAKFLKEDVSKMIQRVGDFKFKKGFVFTYENFMKISLIMLKADLKIPIVMMGESGCGKTYLTEFISTCLLQDKMEELTLYSGVTEKMFIDFMKNCTEIANKLGKSGHRLWVFFDEFNTSPLQSLVAEIMIDRVCSIEPSIYHIPSNMIFIGCCNPFRMKTKKTEVGLVPKTSDTILSHRVYPIPEKLLNYVWDFGQLSESDEKDHIKSMVSAEQNIFDSQENSRREKFITLVYKCHSTVRDIEERSGVSLRDVKRVIRLYKWFKVKIDEINKIGEGSIFVQEEWIRAAICAVYMAYGLRLNGRKDAQDLLLNAIAGVIKGEGAKTIEKSAIKGTLPELGGFYLEKIKKVTAAIPDNIAINRPLKENFITMLACYDAKIPLIICGAPGTSKTLCSQIFDSAMITSLIRTEKLFSSYEKAIHSLYYGGSQTSTADGIAKVFNRAQHYIEQNGEDKPVVVFDEIGLAELSPHNPLKVLHPLLEKPDQKIGFFGISNWTLDLSKMNRLIYLARPDMGEDELIEIFDISVNACGDTPGKLNELQKTLKDYLDNLAKAYLEFRKWQKQTGEVHMIHPNFHGSRDIYGVSKFLYNAVVNKNFKTEDIPSLIKKAIERNFNGAAYHFGENDGGLPLNLVPGLSNQPGLSEKPTKTTIFANIRLQDIGSPYDSVKKQIPENLIILSSSQVFKQIFLNVLKSKASIFGSDFFNETPVLDLVTANIVDTHARFLLVKSEGEVVDNLFMELLKSIMAYRNKDIPIRDWRGIKGKENSVELLTTLKNYITLGYIVVMKNLDDLYGSLYDLFNQKYAEVDGHLYCYLYYGENKHKVEVHPNFKAIILLDTEKEMKGRELELEQPAPFLNRFEKFFVRMSNLLPVSDMEFVYNLVVYLQSMINGKPFRILGMSIDMIASIHKKARQLGQKDAEKVKDYIIRYIYRMATSHFLLRTGLTDKDLQIFKEEHPMRNFNEAITKVKEKDCKVCIFTMSNPIELDKFSKNEFKKGDKSSVLLTSEALIRLGLEARAESLKKMKVNLLLIQFTQKDHLDLVSQLKSSINENKDIKKTIFLIHVDRRASDAEKLNGNIGLNYWDDWENYVIEDLGGIAYHELASMYSLSIKKFLFDIEAKKYYMTLKVLKEVAVATLQRIILETNDVTLSTNFQSIKNMFDCTDNVFVSQMVEKLSFIVDSNQSWRSLIVQRLGNNINYTDLDSALLGVITDPKNGLSDLIKKFILKVNERLTNLASYAVHYYDENLKVQSEYRSDFMAKLNAAFERREILAAVHTKDHFRVPFLAQNYRKFFDTLSRDLKASFKTDYTNLAVNFRKIMNSMKKDKSEDNFLKEAQENLINLETSIFKSFIGTHLNELLSSSEKIVTLITNEPTMRKDFITDIVLGMVLTLDKEDQRTDNPKKGAESQGNDRASEDFTNELQSQFQYFMELCKSLLKENEINATEYTKNFLAMSSILIVAFSTDFRYLLYLIRITNISLPEFSNKITEIKMTLKDKTQGCYSLIDILKKELQALSFPDFSNELLDLKEQKNIYADLVVQAIGNNENKSNCDLHYMVILLELMDNFPKHIVEQMKRRIDQDSKATRSYGDQFVLTLTKKFLEEYILEIPKHWKEFDEDQIENLPLVVSEYINSCAENMNFSPFLDKKMDPVFDILDKPCQKKTSVDPGNRDQIKSSRSNILSGGEPSVYHKERISASLAHIISKKINSPKDYQSLVSELNRFTQDEELIKISQMFEVQEKSERLQLLSIYLVDSIYFNSLKQLENDSIQEKPEIFKHLMEQSDDPNFTSLANLLEYSMIRLLFSAGTLEHILKDTQFRSHFEKHMQFDVNNLWDFLSVHNNFPIIYFLQTIVSREGSLHEFGQSIAPIGKLDELFKTADPGQQIVFSNQKYQKYLREICEEIQRSKTETKVLAEMKNCSKKMKDESFEDSSIWYIFGCAFINKFYNLGLEDKEMNDARKTCKEMVAALGAPPIVTTVMNGIIYSLQLDLSDNLVLKAKNISDSSDEKRLKKVAYMFMLTVACFDKATGYDPAVWKAWLKGDLKATGLKLPVVQSSEIANMSSVFENIIVERLVDGDYLYFKGQRIQHANILENLGVYKCSCGFIYSIGNCGYAAVTIPCPIPGCGQQIGGYDHKLIDRPDHEHIKTLDEFSKLILKTYTKKKDLYNIHFVVNNSTPELTPIKLEELQDVETVRNYLCQVPTELGLDRFDVRLQLRHLWDHLFIFSLPYFIDSKDGVNMNQNLNKILAEQSNNRYSEKDDSIFTFKRMADIDIDSFKDYLLAHMRNDFNTIGEFLKFKLPGSSFVFLRCVLAAVGERLMDGMDMKEPSETLIYYNELKDPRKFMLDQIRLARVEYGSSTMTGKEIRVANDDQKLFKTMIMRNSTIETLKEEITDKGREDYFILAYRLMRHNNLDPLTVKTQFKEALGKSTQVSLLKQLSKYESLLGDFQQIVDAHVRLAVHFNLNYDRAFSYEEALARRVCELTDAGKDPTLARLLDDFKAVWSGLIGKHAEKFPEVFSFAFQCQRNLDVKEFIDSIIIHNEDYLIKFMFLNKDQGQFYMVSIVQTLVAFHNKIVEKISETLNMQAKKKEEGAAVENCSLEDYVGYYNFENHLWENFWFETTPGKENEIHFDLNRIQYLCARNMKKQLINFEEDKISYYNFRGLDQEAQFQNCYKVIRKLEKVEAAEESKRVENLNKLERIKKEGKVNVDGEIKKLKEKKQKLEIKESSLNNIMISWNEEKLRKSLQFLLEIGDYAQTNFLFNDLHISFSEIVSNRSESGGVQRLQSYNPTIHSDMLLGQLGKILRAHQEGLLLCDINDHKADFEKNLDSSQDSLLKQLENNHHLNVEDLKLLLDCFTVAMIEEHRKIGDYHQRALKLCKSETDIELAKQTRLGDLAKKFENTDIKLRSIDLSGYELSDEEVAHFLNFKLNQYVKLKNKLKLMITDKAKRST
jgi:hypothetical protein